MSTRRLLFAVLLSLFVPGAHSASAQTPAAQGSAANGQQGRLVAYRLTNNSIIVGRVVREDATSVVINAGPVGEVTIKRTDIVAQIDPTALTAAEAPPSTPTPPPTPGLGGFSAPGKTFWIRTASFGGSFASAPFKQGSINPAIPGLTGKAAGLTGNQYSTQTQLSILRSSNLRALDIEASYTYVVVQPQGKVMDVPKFSIDYDFRERDGQRFFVLARYSWYKDVVRHINFSNQAFTGVGALIVDDKKVKLGAVPVVGVIREERDVPRFDDKYLMGWGGIERMIITPNPFVQIEQREVFDVAFNDTAYRTLESYVSFKGQITKRVALTFDVTHKYDNALALAQLTVPIPGIGTVTVIPNNLTQVTAMAGIQIKF